jgi:peptidoglycan/xylan/chitin deacetylase (PgdA/CDA1 family)
VLSPTGVAWPRPAESPAPAPCASSAITPSPTWPATRSSSHTGAARFRHQLDSLRRAGYQFIHPDELLAYLDGRAGLPRRPLLLTFDDC